MKRRIFSLLLVCALLVTLLPGFAKNASAATQSSYAPYAMIEYGYSANVTCGTIRYVSQVSSDSYFYSKYWPTSNFGYYVGPSVECGTASMSMALSYVGVNKTANDILSANNGGTVFTTSWGDASYRSVSASNLSGAMDNYINGNGKYTPPVIHIPGYSAAGHYVVVAGRISSNTYQILDPWQRALTTMTVNGSSATYTVYGSTIYDTIDQIHQWYNPNASLDYASSCDSYASHCQVKVTASTPINSQPCSTSSGNGSTTLETAAVGNVYTATKLYKNDAGNLWYRVTARNGNVGYLYAGHCSYIDDITSDITLSGASTPSGHVAGSIFVVNGTIKSSYNLISSAAVYVHSGFGTSGAKVTGSSANVSGTSYTLVNSTIDYNTAFDALASGKYTYAVYASYQNYYASDAKTLKSNTGTLTLMDEYFVVIPSSVSQSTCTHANTTTTIQNATCTSGGITVTACSKCGKVTENTVATLGHAYGGWITTNATCTVDGYKTRSCANCGKTETEVIPSTGHSYSVTHQDANCENYETFHYSCSNCGDSYSITAEDLAKTWSETKPQGIDDSRIETKTQYRYADCTSTSWVETGHKTVTYVNTWASGFNTAHSTYAQYNRKSEKVTASETANAKTVVNSDKKVGYLWYHWCSTSVTSSWAYQTGSYNTFHVYYDTNDPSNYDCDTYDYSYKTAHSSCSNSQWWFPVEVYQQDYTTYAKTYDGKQWGNWSDWSDTAHTPVENIRKVESRTMYRLKDAELGDHVWANGTCSVCGEVCTHPSYTNNACTVCGKTKPAENQDFYLFGFINGANYGCEGDYQNLGQYKFVDGKLTARFNQTSYVAVKTGDNQNWYMTDGYPGNYITSATLYNTSKLGTNADKLYVPANVTVTFTLVDNGNDTYTLSYAAAPVETPTITLKYPTLSFEGEVFYNVYYTVSNASVNVEDMGLLTWYNRPANTASATYETAEEIIPGATYNASANMYMVRSQGVPAKMLGDNMYIRVYAKLSDGTYAYSPVTYYSAKAYAADILNNSSNPDMKSLVVAMLNYGAAAQVHFNHNVNTLMNADLTAAQKALAKDFSNSMISTVVTPDSAKTVNFKSNGGFSNGYPSVSFDGAFSINYYLTPKKAVESGITLYCWDLATYNSVSTLTETNATTKVTMATASTPAEYFANYTGIAAKQIDETVFVAGVYTSGGVRYSSPVLCYSLSAYCADQIAKGSATMQDFAKATVVYGDAAKTYFANLNG